MRAMVLRESARAGFGAQARWARQFRWSIPLDRRPKRRGPSGPGLAAFFVEEVGDLVGPLLNDHALLRLQRGREFAFLLRQEPRKQCRSPRLLSEEEGELTPSLKTKK